MLALTSSQRNAKGDDDGNVIVHYSNGGRGEEPDVDRGMRRW